MDLAGLFFKVGQQNSVTFEVSGTASNTWFAFADDPYRVSH